MVVLLCAAASISYWGPLIYDVDDDQPEPVTFEAQSDSLAWFGTTTCYESDPSYLQGMIVRILRFDVLRDLADNTSRGALAPVLVALAGEQMDLASVRIEGKCTAVHASVYQWMDRLLVLFATFLDPDESITEEIVEALDAEEAMIEDVNEAMERAELQERLPPLD